MPHSKNRSDAEVAVPNTPPGEAEPDPKSRRSFIRAGSLGVTSVALAATGVASVNESVASESSPAATRPRSAPLAVTPACSGHETPAATEGPLFKPESPERTNFITPAITGVYLRLRGVVYDTACKPLPDCLIEFWQCDQNGDYDTAGFSLRGHQRTTARGTYELETIIPRDYWGRWGKRAPHIHTQVQAPGGPILVTQLYFPDDTKAYGRDFAALNARDRLLNRACTITLESLGTGRYAGTFDFVISTTA
ncbi:dioxygenase family protein [Streptomyces sp. KR80]|uniref:dioxygenase family protein n=1 Tax=Streptomyces sp. KR80 TaxID=3457426 RepID=UPI003FD0659B